MAPGFYRPHSGFPDWQPSTDRQEVLDEALGWACKSNRLAVLERLARAGARLNADPYRGTPLIWAAVCNHTETVAWLLDHGADINQKGTFGGLTHGQGITALHMAAQYGHIPVVKLLLERGADRSIKDDPCNVSHSLQPDHRFCAFGRAAAIKPQKTSTVNLNSAKAIRNI
jgi:ankyrin repeat protein